MSVPPVETSSSASAQAPPPASPAPAKVPAQPVQPVQPVQPAQPIQPAHNGGQNGDTKAPFSWHKPHPIFVILLVGPDEQPYGIQKDFLCDRSEYFRNHLALQTQDTVEHIVRLPDTTTEIFGLAQNFLYSGKVDSGTSEPPSYESLVGLWKLGHKLKIEGLCEASLTAMLECRRLTQRIPSTPLLIQVWKDTPEGSTIRKLLLSWAAEYMRSSDARAEFAKSLPQEVLSELVVTMSSFDELPAAPTPANAAPTGTPTNGLRKNVHYLDDPSDEEILKGIKRRRSSGGAPGPSSALDAKPAPPRKPSRTPLPKPQKRRSSGFHADGRSFSTAQKLEFCADLLTRMLSGPGFWTRLVGPFKEPVVPEEDGVPDYFDKVKRPMDLSTIKGKMDRHEYADEEEFLTDMRQIFENCFLYWKKDDPMWLAGEKLQKTFEDKYSGMNKWIAKMGGDEGD